MADQKEREFVNPKWLVRQIGKACPPNLPSDLRETVRALWAYSDDFIEKADLESGNVKFSGSVSYTQLDEFFGCGKGTSKQRMERLRDEYGLVDWNRGRYNVHFVVHLGCRIPNSSQGTEDLTEMEDDSSEATEESSQGTEGSESGYGSSESGYPNPTLSSLAFAGEKKLASVRSSDQTEEQKQNQPQPRKDSVPTTQREETFSVPPRPPSGRLRRETIQEDPAAAARREADERKRKADAERWAACGLHPNLTQTPRSGRCTSCGKPLDHLDIARIHANIAESFRKDREERESHEEDIAEIEEDIEV